MDAAAPGRARYIAQADAICTHTEQALTPVQNHLFADENRLDTSIKSDTLANRKRVANDFEQVVVGYKSKLTALGALSAPAPDRARVAKYLALFGLQTSLIGQLIAAYDLPPGATVSTQHVTALADQLVVAQRLGLARVEGDAAAHAVGYHVCGSGH